MTKIGYKYFKYNNFLKYFIIFCVEKYDYKLISSENISGVDFVLNII